MTMHLNMQIGEYSENQSQPTVKVRDAAKERDQSHDDEEDGFDALYIKRLLNLYKEKNIPLSAASAQQKRNKRPASPKKGCDVLLNATVDNARYQLSDRFTSLSTPKYYNHRRKNQPQTTDAQSLNLTPQKSEP